MRTVSILDPLEATLRPGKPSTLRIGLAIPLSGLLGMNGPSAMEAAILAASEVNAPHGRDRRLELVVVDSGMGAETVAAEIAHLAISAGVEAFVGLHTSRTLQHIEAAIGGSIPYVFASGFEATHRSDGIFCPGETPVKSASGLRRLIRDHDLQRVAIVGTDYVWPRAARIVQRAAVQSSGAGVAEDLLIPEDPTPAALAGTIDRILAAGADTVVLNMAGRDLVSVLTGLRHRGLDRKIVRVAGGCLEENALFAIGGDDSGNLYTSMQSFETLPCPRRRELNDRYRHATGGTAPALNAWAERCYEGVRLLARCDQRASLDVVGFSAMTDTADAWPSGSGQYLAVAEGLRFKVLHPEIP